MTDRLRAGWQLYQDGAVKFIRESDGQYEFEVHGSEVYDVYFKDGAWYCYCWDFKRHCSDGWTCKHIIASIFMLFELFKLKVFVEATK